MRRQPVKGMGGKMRPSEWFLGQQSLFKCNLHQCCMSVSLIMADLVSSTATSVTLCPDLAEWTRHTLFVCEPPTPHISQPATLPQEEKVTGKNK